MEASAFELCRVPEDVTARPGAAVLKLASHEGSICHEDNDANRS